MARGRMINNAITEDKRINDLSDDTSRLAFTWLVTFADCEGRVAGDPAIVRSKLFPRREDVTAARMEQYIREWAALGLVIWYEAEGDWWIAFPAFEKNQAGLNKSKEAKGRIPAPPQEPTLPADNSGVTPELLQSKAAQENLREPKEKLNPTEEIGANAQADGADAPGGKPPQPARKPKPAKPADSPAVAYLTGVGKVRLKDVVKQQVDAAVTARDGPDLERWKSVVNAWMARGYKPNNCAGMLDWYRDGIPAQGSNGKNGKPRAAPTEPKGYDGIREFLAEKGYGNGDRS